MRGVSPGVTPGPDSTEHDIATLVETFATTFAPVVADLAASDSRIDLGPAADIVEEYADGLLNPQQQRALTRLEQRLS
ncbi:hypothetical protein BOH66_03455 [Microbacterium aurum]|uniref:Uncharacterized protein n=1 Tax=Microbacterium aurum TaxID=36805 RepID=A0A1P8U5Q0_9MICO|nr:hypothetical protein BOH66_03455 [Microbacterium aurum]